MLVSCLCPTYNRAPNHLHLLGEVIESFRRQVLPSGVDAELIILNDTPGQTLDCPWNGDSTKRLHILNECQRYTSLGAKMHSMISRSNGLVLMPWEDDDISLPGRIAQAVAALQSGHPYFNPQRSWYLDSAGLHWDHCHGYCHNASAMMRSAYEAAGGYRGVSGSQDAEMDSRLRARFGVSPPVTNPREWQYIYRWGVSPCHLSGVADGPDDDPHGNYYRRIGSNPIASGRYTISPLWRTDYDMLCRLAS